MCPYSYIFTIVNKLYVIVFDILLLIRVIIVICYYFLIQLKSELLEQFPCQPIRVKLKSKKFVAITINNLESNIESNKIYLFAF